MIIPVRCFSCGKVVGALYEDYQKLVEEGSSVKDALDKLEVKRFCCRTTMMSNADMIDTIGKFS